MEKQKTWPRYQLEIDEDGFPMFDGIRIDDETFVRELFANFYRSDPKNSTSALMSRCEGEELLVKAFESPLVAQSIGNLDQNESEWIFPAGVQYKVLHSQIFEDEWHRLRTEIGAFKIFATLSRKAQAEFGKRLSELDTTELKVLPWYEEDQQKAVGGPEFWDLAYQEKQDGWEMKAPTPVLTKEWDRFLKYCGLQAAGRVAVLGAGRGHEARWVEKNSSWDVVAVDFSLEAKTEFERIYPDSRVKYLCASVFEHLEENPESFDVIVEHTFFCAISPRERQRYFKSAARGLKPGGYLVGVFWMRSSRRGPPFGFTPWELRESLRDTKFEILEFTLSPHSWPARWGQEYYVVLRKL